MSDAFVLKDIKRKLVIEQTVRDLLHVLDTHQLPLAEGLVAWNMLGFTMFQELYPDASHQEVQEKMINFSESLFNSRHPSLSSASQT